MLCKNLFIFQFNYSLQNKKSRIYDTIILNILSREFLLAATHLACLVLCQHEQMLSFNQSHYTLNFDYQRDKKSNLLFRNILKRWVIVYINNKPWLQTDTMSLFHFPAWNSTVNLSCLLFLRFDGSNAFTSYDKSSCPCSRASKNFLEKLVILNHWLSERHGFFMDNMVYFINFDRNKVH